MSAIRLLSAATLSLVFIAAFFGLVKQSEWNGLFNRDSILNYRNRILPGTNIPMQLASTGIPSVDNYLAFMVSFFWSALDIRNIRAHLQATLITGTLSGVWLTMLLQAHTASQSAAVFAITYLAEIMGELLGIGLFTPLWCIFHLLVTAPSSRGSERGQARSQGRLGNPGGSLAYAFLLGHVVPTVLMIVLKPDHEGLASQQLWTVLRLFHPVLVFGFWSCFTLLQSLLGNKSKSTAQQDLSSRRKMYFMGILFSAAFHVSAMTMLQAPGRVPGWLSEQALIAIDPRAVLVPTPYWTATAPRNVPLSVGVATFLQWDNICAASAGLIWSFTLYLESCYSHLVKKSDILQVLAQSFLVTFLAGPGAATLFLMQERENVMAISVEQDEKKRQ